MNCKIDKTVILIGGRLATGKTTLAKALSKELNIPYFYKDILKEYLGDVFGFSSREENLKLSKGAFNILYEVSVQLVSNNESFILESNFRQEEVDKLETLFKQNNYKIVSFRLTADSTLLYERYLERFKLGNRSNVHANFNSFEEFNEYQKMLDGVKYPGKVVDCDAKEFVDIHKAIESI